MLMFRVLVTLGLTLSAVTFGLSLGLTLILREEAAKKRNDEETKK